MEKPNQIHNRNPKSREVLKCPRCDSSNTKFCYYNNYSLSEARYFCKACRRYWTIGGTLRNVPVGGGCRKKKQSSNIGESSGIINDVTEETYGTGLLPDVPAAENRGEGQDVNHGGLRGIIGKETGIVTDPHAPKDQLNLGSDPSNSVTSTQTEITQLQHSFDKLVNGTGTGQQQVQREKEEEDDDDDDDNDGDDDEDDDDDDDGMSNKPMSFNSR